MVPPEVLLRLTGKDPPGDAIRLGAAGSDAQYRRADIGYHSAKRPMLLIFRHCAANVAHMKMRSFLIVFPVLLALGAPASAACYADYKAKRENPLKLHYGVIQIDSNPCAMSDKVRAAVAKRLSKSGWQLLQVQSVFDDSGLGKRKKDAGQFFLRF